MKRILVILALLLKISFASALEIKVINKEFSSFVFDFSKRIYKNKGLDYKFIPIIHDSSDLTKKVLDVKRGRYNDIDDFFRFMLSAGNIEDLCKKIQGLPLFEKPREDLLSTIRGRYNKYIEENGNNVRTVDSKYLINLKNYFRKNKQLIDDFLSDMATFYGLEKFPYPEIVLYVTPVEKSTEAPSTTFLGKNVMLSQIHGDFSEYLGVIMHELAHLCYAHQPVNLQYVIDNFYLSKDYHYAEKTYAYLDEGLADALGNGVFAEKLTGKADIQYNNVYIKGFANALYPICREYINSKKAISEEFLKSSINTFVNSLYKLPDLHRHLGIMASSRVVLAKHFVPGEANRVFNK